MDDPVDPLMSALYELIAVATDVTDMSVAHLMGNPKVCEAVVQRVQNIGKAWDDHSDWPGRNWYVQVLLAVASLSRVVEWWEAEKQFWNFDEQNDEQDEPLMFVMKPADEEAANMDMELEGFRLDDKPPSPALQRPKTEIPTAPVSPLPPQETSAPTSSRATPQQEEAATESARVLATERLRLQAETAQNQNIVIELSLDGDHFIWVNHAWRVVVGTDPEGLPGTRISSLLAASDWGVFKEATNRLQEDDSHTVEVRFKLQTEPNVQKDPSAGALYQLMEGKGMLMIDREDGQPSHTMWVVRPLAPPRYDDDTSSIVLEADDLAPEPASTIKQSFLDRNYTEPATPFPFNEPIVTDAILCRICESQIPQWYFEKHSETCAETHRLEAEIMECNESIAELRNAIRDLCTGIDRSSPSSAPEYRGLPVFIPSSSPLMSSPLQLFRANKLQRFSVKRMQRRFLDQVDDILQACLEISVPSLKEEESKEPIERQRLLSPTSERKITQVRNWAKPTTEDAALGQLLQDAERVMRQKIDSVVRMQNTIRYAEKIWTEWEERIQSYLGTIPESSDSGSESSEDGPDEIIVESPPLSRRTRTFSEATTVDDHSSTTSEYNFGREYLPREPSPASCLSPIPFITSPTDIKPMPSITSPLSPPPAHYQGHGYSPPLTVPQSSVVTFGPRTQQLTRSSTPSSVSSPLARAPIIAAVEDNNVDYAVPSMSLDDAPESTSTLTLKTRKSTQSLLEPKFVVTPPASPQVAGKDGPGLQREGSSRRSNRRHSNAALLTSPSAAGPLSPRQSGGVPLPRANPTSIKDFEIIKPISKGAFGSVFLAKKKVTGDYYAIKVLKKADMIAKNQITNVKAERMILMKQAESPFVAKLYFTFQSKENLYLVMEYLNGGDCAALIKTLGCLPEEWTKNYIAEVVLGLEYLHQRGIVHRDLKPDNLLIDQHGHLKLTDFGLSRIGLLGRQSRETQFGRALGRYGSRSRPPSMDSAYFSSPLVFNDPSGGSYFTQRPASVSRVGNSPHLPPADDVGDSSASELLAGFQARRNGRMSDSPLQSFATELTTDLRSHSSNASGTTPPGEQKFVGTPDYLAPETILGLRGDDAAVDWWALGVITYEFLYGIPPFHADNPEKVFENILSGMIEWHDDWVDYSPEVRDFMQSLMHIDPNERLGSRGADEVKAHPWFEGMAWDKVTATEAAFIPQVSDPESTDYFDPRGAIPQLFHDDEDFVALTSRSQTESPANNMPPPSAPVPIAGKETPNSAGSDDFGSFSFKNLPVLKQANDDVIRKIKTDQMAPMTQTLSEPVTSYHQRKKSVSHRIKKPPNVVTTMDPKMMSTNPPSPATSTSSIASSPSRTSLPPSTPGSGIMGGHSRKPSEYGALERFKLNHMEGDRRNSMPSRLRTASVSSAGDGSGSETWNSSAGGGGGGGSQPEASTPASSVYSIDLRKAPDPSDRVVTCLLAEDNPITAKIIETLLVRLGCRVIVVADGSEAISVAMGDIKFDCILMDLQMPVLDGEGAARYIKSTNGKNTNTPIIAVSAYSGTDPNETSNVFDAALSKPLQRADLLNVFRQLGFKTTPKQVVTAAKVVTSTSQMAQPPLAL